MDLCQGAVSNDCPLLQRRAGRRSIMECRSIRYVVSAHSPPTTPGIFKDWICMVWQQRTAGDGLDRAGVGKTELFPPLLEGVEGIGKARVNGIVAQHRQRRLSGKRGHDCKRSQWTRMTRGCGWKSRTQRMVSSTAVVLRGDKSCGWVVDAGLSPVEGPRAWLVGCRLGWGRELSDDMKISVPTKLVKDPRPGQELQAGPKISRC